MIKKTIQLYNAKEYHYPTKGGFIPNLTAYVHEEEIRKAIVIVPGGAYGLVSPSEAEVVALKFYNMGYNAFVVSYTINFNNNKPLKLQPLKDISRAMRIIRFMAKDLNVSCKEITVCGFSAGGHLVASLAVHYNHSELIDEIFEESNRPDKVILAYPVITMGEETHAKSKLNLLGDASEEEIDFFSIEKHVHNDMPPIFMWCTKLDTISYQNCLLFDEACRKTSINCKFHVFETGPHGLSVADENWATGKLGEPYTAEQIITEICYAISNNEQASLPEPFNTAKDISEIGDLFIKWRNKKYDISFKNDEVAKWVEMAHKFINE